MRNIETDKAIELRFGKPDWECSFIKDGMMWTPIGNYKLYRIDPYPEGVIWCNT